MFIRIYFQLNKKRLLLLLIISNNKANLGNKKIIKGFNHLIRKELRKSYDEYAKYDEASTKASKANGAKAG